MKFSLASLARAVVIMAAAPLPIALAETDSSAWNILSNAELPHPISDHSSTFVPSQGEGVDDGIYIAGGCDSPNGNTYRMADGLVLDFFLCESISDKLHVFDANTLTFTTSSKKLPQPRYRHAAVHANGMLWLVGGRTVPDDTIIREVDVYDPKTDTWKTVGTIPEDLGTSDNGAFASADGSTVYVVGGYNQNYYDPDALSTTFSFETKAALDQLDANLALGLKNPVKDLPIQRHADLLQGRGDIHAVSSHDGTKAYVAGGNAGMCQPLTSAEVYDLEADEWIDAGNLLKARSDGAMVEAAGTIFVIGGEVNHPNQCADLAELVPPLSHQSLAVDDVETLEYDFDGALEWKDVANIPEFRFRFSAASWPATGVAYAFGGQTSFDESCKCFPTTTEITAIDSEILLPNNNINQAPPIAATSDDPNETLIEMNESGAMVMHQASAGALALVVAVVIAMAW